MDAPKLEIIYRPVEDLIPYARNSRTHSPEQVAQIAASIREFGFLNPVILDGANGIIAGHGRVLALQKLGLLEVPTVDASHLTEAQRRAYVIADNRIALSAGWDSDMLKIELEELKGLDFNIDLVGFELGELKSIFAGEGLAPAGTIGNYSRKIEAPIYEPTGPAPELEELIDRSKAAELEAEIAAAGLPVEISAFLYQAAQRHNVFDYGKVANYYAHAPTEVQALFEKSALVIIDFDQAIEGGFIRLSKEILRLAGIDEDKAKEEGLPEQDEALEGDEDA